MENNELYDLKDKAIVLDWIKEHREYIKASVYEKNPDIITGYERALKHLEYALTIRQEYI